MIGVNCSMEILSTISQRKSLTEMQKSVHCATLEYTVPCTTDVSCRQCSTKKDSPELQNWYQEEKKAKHTQRSSSCLLMYEEMNSTKLWIIFYNYCLKGAECEPSIVQQLLEMALPIVTQTVLAMNMYCRAKLCILCACTITMRS